MDRRIVPLASLLFALAAGCGEKEPTDSEPPAQDVDQDGWSVDDGDCDDLNDTINPGAAETCDGVDNDCDGDVDEDASDATTWYLDADGDGYGDALAGALACERPSDHVLTDDDCDDSNAAVNPDATETCNGIDDDCDDLVDDDDTGTTGTSTWYVDADADGYGDADSTTEACEQPSGYIADATDCNDSDAVINAAATEDCDDIDNDCDGLVDDDDPDVTGTTTWYLDADGDGYGGTIATTDACEQPSGWVATATDCDDLDASAHPGGTELCDGADNDCDGTTDEADATDASTWYADSDGDGYGNAASSTAACTAPSGHVDDDTDCNDRQGAINPGTSEICNAVDDDCDGLTDDNDSDVTGTTTWYLDADGDGYGRSTATTEACTAPSLHVASAGDCDDLDATAYSGATESCDGVDNDCDGSVDEGSACGTEDCSDGADNDSDGLADCDDDDCSEDPACAEMDCSDGGDSDGDGLVDCDDDDCEDSPDCIEDCSNGSDDDGDGLVDCEDGDCAEEPTCYEADCTDGLDDDGDGLVDCQDEDCWGAECHPGGARSRVTGGIEVGFLRNVEQWQGVSGGACRSGGGLSSTKFLEGYRVAGTVQVLPSGVSSWEATTARTTCTWQVRFAEASWTRDTRWNFASWWASSAPGDLERSDITVGSGCRLGVDDWFLPEQLWVKNGKAYASYMRAGPYSTIYLGALWYDPVWLSSSWTRSSTARVYRSGCNWHTYYSYSRSYFYFGVNSADTYHATP